MSVHMVTYYWLFTRVTICCYPPAPVILMTLIIVLMMTLQIALYKEALKRQREFLQSVAKYKAPSQVSSVLPITIY